MPDVLNETSQILNSEVLEGYGFDSVAFVSIIEKLKKEPTEQMRAWMAAHPEYKTWNCAALAAFCGLSEPTLKKLKSGQIADPRASTVLMLYKKFGIWPKQIIKGIPVRMECSDGADQLKAQLKAVEDRLEDKRQRLERADGVVDRLQVSLGRIRRYNMLLSIALVALVAALLVFYLVWEVCNPDQGLTALVRHLLK